MKVKLTLTAELTYELLRSDFESLSTEQEIVEYTTNSTPYEDIVNDDRAIVTVKGEVVK